MSDKEDKLPQQPNLPEGHAEPHQEFLDIMSVGECLRHNREAAGKSIEQLSATTKIPERIILAVEEERFEDTPPIPVLRGFLKVLAEEIGISPAELLSKFDVASVKENVGQVLPDWDNRPGPSRKRFLGWILGISFVLLSIAAGYFYYLGNWGFEVDKTPEGLKEGKAEKKFSSIRQTGKEKRVGKIDKSKIKKVLVKNQSVPRPSIFQHANSSSHSKENKVSRLDNSSSKRNLGKFKTGNPGERKVVASSPMVLHITAGDDTWLRVVVDGKKQDEIFLLERESRKWKGNRSFVLTVGNASTTRVALNGFAVKLPETESNFVRDFLINRSNFP